MKNKKLLGMLIALSGSVAAIGTAFALYKVEDAPKDIIISAKTTDDVAFNAAVVNSDDAHATLIPGDGLRTRNIELSAGFNPTQDSFYIQPYYVAHLTFKVSSESDAFISNISPNTWIELGTQDGDNSYGSYWKNNELNSGGNIAANGKSVTWETNYPIFAGNGISRFKFHLQLKDNITAEEYLAIAESSYQIDFAVEQPTDYVYAYLVGSATTSVEEKAWVDKDEFQMTVNAKANIFQWMFTTGTVAGKGKLIDGGSYKIHKGDVYCCNDPNHTWHEVEDNISNEGKSFYWDGESGHDGHLFFN